MEEGEGKETRFVLALGNGHFLAIRRKGGERGRGKERIKEGDKFRVGGQGNIGVPQPRPKTSADYKRTPTQNTKKSHGAGEKEAKFWRGHRGGTH